MLAPASRFHRIIVISFTKILCSFEGTWSTTGNMATARAWHTASLLPNGKILVAGGSNGEYTRNAELYDPFTGKHRFGLFWIVGCRNSVLPLKSQHFLRVIPSDYRIALLPGCLFKR